MLEIGTQRPIKNLKKKTTSTSSYLSMHFIPGMIYIVLFTNIGYFVVFVVLKQIFQHYASVITDNYHKWVTLSQ